MFCSHVRYVCLYVCMYVYMYACMYQELLKKHFLYQANIFFSAVKLGILTWGQWDLLPFGASL